MTTEYEKGARTLCQRPAPNCGYVLVIPEGMHGFLSDESDRRSSRVGDFQAREAERYGARRIPKYRVVDRVSQFLLALFVAFVLVAADAELRQFLKETRLEKAD